MPKTAQARNRRGVHEYHAHSFITLMHQRKPRRRDTPPWIEATQREMLHILAEAPTAKAFPDQLPPIHRHLWAKLADLRENRVPLKKLLVTQTLSRRLEEYKVPSPAAKAAMQLAKIGKDLAPGQGVRFLYTLGKPGVWTWDLPGNPEAGVVDKGYYQELLLRAAHTVVQPLGVEEETLRTWLLSNVGYGAPPGELAENQEMPLFMGNW